LHIDGETGKVLEGTERESVGLFNGENGQQESNEQNYGHRQMPLAFLVWKIELELHSSI